MTLPLDRQNIIVTGAGQGLGAAIARRFAAAGARLALMDYDAAALAETTRACGAGALAIEVDLSDRAATAAAIDRTLGEFGSIHTLIHNAAILRPTPFGNEDFDSFFRTVNVGLQAGFQLAHAVWPGMLANGGGALVFVSSRSGIEGFANESAYCAAKHGLEGLAKCLAIEGAEHGIKAHAVTPGMYMRTPMSDRNYTDDARQLWVDPDQLTPAFLALATRHPLTAKAERVNAWTLSQQLASGV